MTPKEKAESIFEKLRPYINYWNVTSDAPRNDEKINEDAKKCVLICVEEMLVAAEVIDQYQRPLREKDEETWTVYWNKVKEELSKL